MYVVTVVCENCKIRDHGFESSDKIDHVLLFCLLCDLFQGTTRNSHCGPGPPGHTYTSIDIHSMYRYGDKNRPSVLGTLWATVHVCEMLEDSLA